MNIDRNSWHNFTAYSLNGLTVCVYVCVFQSQRTADVCLVHCSCGRRPTQTNNVVFEINKFLIGLQSGQERQRHGRLAGQRAAEDDTNRSVSSIEEDFLTASEQLGEDSEDDPFRNGKQSIHLSTNPSRNPIHPSIQKISPYVIFCMVLFMSVYVMRKCYFSAALALLLHLPPVHLLNRQKIAWIMVERALKEPFTFSCYLWACFDKSWPCLEDCSGVFPPQGYFLV